MERSMNDLAEAFDKVVREHGVGAAWTVIDGRIASNVYELLVHLGQTPLHRKRLRSLRLADQRIENVKAPRLRPRERRAL